MLITGRLYDQGQIAAELTDLAQLPAGFDPGLHQHDHLLWIGLHEPSLEELNQLKGPLGLHPLAIEDAVGAHELPKVDVYPHHLFITAYTARLDGNVIRFGETSALLGANFLVTTRHGSERTHTPVRARLEAAPAMLSKGADYVWHAILDHIVDGYAPVIDAIEDQVIAMEQRALSAFLSMEDVASLYHFRHELIRFHRMIEPVEDVAHKLGTLDLPFVDAEARPYYRDVEDHVRRVLHRVAMLREILASVIETSGLLEQQRQGANARQLAAWAAILAVPTAIAGIYGMNFQFMPELGWRYGYYMVLALMAVTCLTLYWKFKRSGWL